MLKSTNILNKEHDLVGPSNRSSIYSYFGDKEPDRGLVTRSGPPKLEPKVQRRLPESTIIKGRHLMHQHIISEERQNAVFLS